MFTFVNQIKITMLKLFNDEEIEKKWEKDWDGMPEFSMKDLEPFQKIIVNFESKEDVIEFSKMLGQKLTYKTKSVWFKQSEYTEPKNYIYTNESKVSNLHNIKGALGEQTD